MLAFCLIRVPALRSGGAVQSLRKLAGVTEAHAVYSETDVIAKLEVPDLKALDELVLGKIQDLPGVESTRTFIVMESLDAQ